MTAATACYTIAPFTAAPGRVVTVQAVGLALQAQGHDIEIAPGDPLGLRVYGDDRVRIEFSLVDPAQTRYYVVGLALQPAGGGTGRDDFPLFTVLGRALTVTDDNRRKSSYEFWLLLQDADGNLGILDPKIQNT